MLKEYFKLLRIKHYIKNLLVFAPLACSGLIFNPDKLLAAIWGFLAFCFLSSTVYIINDIRDRERDRIHPKKKNRPIASGAISVTQAAAAALGCLFFCLILNGMVFTPGGSAVLAAYFVLNLAYSSGLKNVPILDLAILVSGFFFRVLYGAIITNIVISSWMYMTVIGMSLYLALGKRRNELRTHRDGSTRKVLELYPEKFLDQNMVVCETLVIVFYSLWAISEETVLQYHGRPIVMTVPLVMLIVMKYNYDVEKSRDGDPVEVLMHDKVLLILSLLFVAVVMSMLYV